MGAAGQTPPARNSAHLASERTPSSRPGPDRAPRHLASVVKGVVKPPCLSIQRAPFLLQLYSSGLVAFA
jgi:hypothetical protein